MVVVATLKDGRVIAKANITEAKDRVNAGKLYITATLNDLRLVENVMQFHLNVYPNTNATPEVPTITGNVVGVTVYCAAGTTIQSTSEVIGIGI